EEGCEVVRAGQKAARVGGGEGEAVQLPCGEARRLDDGLVHLLGESGVAEETDSKRPRLRAAVTDRAGDVAALRRVEVDVWGVGTVRDRKRRGRATSRNARIELIGKAEGACVCDIQLVSRGQSHDRIVPGTTGAAA